MLATATVYSKRQKTTDQALSPSSVSTSMIDLDSSSLDLSSPPANLHSDHVTALVSPTDLPSSQCDAHCVEYDIIDDPLDSDDSPPCSIEHDICDDSVWYHDAEESLSHAGALQPCNIDICDDIGLLLRSMPQSVVRNLPLKKKYSLLINQFKPNSSFKFPSRFIDGCNRACQYNYLLDNPWFVYSKAEDGLFCLPCVLFANVKGLGQLVCKKFDHWTKKSTKFASHNSKKYHQLAMTQVDALKTNMNKPGSSIEDHIRQTNKEEVLRNRYIIRSLAEAVLFCGRQCISLRDDSTADAGNNRGNFLALVDFAVKSGNRILGDHLESAARNAIYTSKTTQNEIIECIGEHLRDKILKDIKAAKWYSILCDEVVDVGNKEQVSIVLRFVDGQTIREEFLDFVTVERITGEVLANKLKDMLISYGLDIGDCRGQGYDSASNMSGKSGVQGRLMAVNPKAIYVHCNSHILNLCIVQACSLQAIKNMNATVTETAYFFNNSSKRQNFLEKVIDKTSSIVKVKDLCRTRWIYRHEAYENFHLLFKYLIKVMAAISERDSTYGEMNWDGKTIIAANGLFKMFQSFSFITSFVVTMNAMAVIKPVSIKLQYRASDIVYAYSKVKDVIDELGDIRKDDKIIHSWYVQSEAVAAEVNVVPEVPWIASRQCHRDNVEHASTEEYYRRTIIYPFLDNLIAQMHERFGDTQIIASKLINLVPSVICNVNDVCFDDLISFYNDDLPNPSVVATEILRWKAKWERQGEEDRPESLVTAIQQCDKDFFPNIYALLHLGCTVPVTSSENERANSVLKNLKSFLRSTQGQERLSSLALMHIHYSLPVDLDEVVERFKLKCNRRINL